MRKVNLRMNELYKYESIKELIDHDGNKKRVSKKLGISSRQVNRLINIYKEKGKSGFIHGNRGRVPTKALDSSISEDIILLYKNKYYDFNFKHFKEFLEEVENIKVSYKFVYKTLTNEGIISPKARRQTKRKHKRIQLLKEKKLQDKSLEDIDIIIDNEIALEDSHPRCEKPKNFGEIIEMDGSIHLWFGEQKICLHLSIDKATNTITGGYFDYQETLNGYYQVLYQILLNHGIPYMFVTDNRTVFNYMSLNPDKRTSDKDVLTQFGYACKQLGISIKTTSVSQAKGLIERTNGTFQGRLVQELRLNNITSIEKANEYLKDIFIPNYNKRFALNIKQFPSVFETTPNSNIINYTLAVLTARKIDSGNSIKFKNKYYQPYLNNDLKCFKNKTECLVIESFNKDLLVSIDDKIFELKELAKHEKYSKNFDEAKEEIKTNTYIPSMKCSWRVNEYKYHIKRAHNNHKYA